MHGNKKPMSTSDFPCAFFKCKDITVAGRQELRHKDTDHDERNSNHIEYAEEHLAVLTTVYYAEIMIISRETHPFTSFEYVSF